ncbi:OLC1v1003092C1 [Oldenlandia corymbosa var. corymbosa]|uniref:OLC1v1003092C1 n=1 Tax=Oldenlandia corymbosa var. corymbosa TaxID=529605 RepID=A0AAV1DBM0_OLDCO|nr:OLC1v1003092C1 [Oldenlandia corymbosa var. corymbosa]
MGLRAILTLAFLLSFHSLAFSANLETYIVHVEPPEFHQTDQLSTTTLSSSSTPNEDLDRWYHSFLPTITTTSSSSSEGSGPRMVRGYHNIFKGFAAQLSPEHVKAMETKPGFISARPQKVMPLHTTHTPNFLGLHQNMGLWSKSNYGRGVIIGVIDSGIFPDHPSFSDEGMPPPPAKWKGKCEFNASLCNNKLIGARHFLEEDVTPTDQVGHGTHTASTVAGNFVKGANVFGNANGTAVGVAPLAHLAIYKVCDILCAESAILTAMDVAIDDGVDVLSLSLGGFPSQFYEDSIALGAYSAVQKGIFVSCAAGNDGPGWATVSNGAPWILTVGASTIDRKLKAVAVLGNKQELEGESAYQPKNFPSTKQYPLLYPGLNQSDTEADRYCSEGLRNITAAVRGRIVVCEVGGFIDEIEKGQNVKDAGGVGMIILNDEASGYTTDADAHVLPATHLSYADRIRLIAYMNSTTLPTSSISFKGTVIGDPLAPQVASFSSRGPNIISRGILKPDILGPGSNILAAWHQPIDNGKKSTKSNFNMISGTSMACPHLSGVAALLKSSHPDWSPAAIKSAIMTTADLVNHGKNPIQDERQLSADIFATGSGHVNPNRANDPGLIYDIDPKDYIPYLCGLNYTDRQVGIFLQRKVHCTKSIPDGQLNYPSFSLNIGKDERVQNYTRTVTNVGEAESVYSVDVVPPVGVKVTIKPQRLSFSRVNQKLTYQVTFEMADHPDHLPMSQGSITWTSQKYSVRVPIAVVFTDTPSSFF